MSARFALVFVLVLAGLLAACGATDTPAGQQSAAAGPAKAPVLPAARELEVRLYGAFRAGLRALSIATSAGGESGDIGQPVPAGLVERVSCRSAERCVVRWRDVDARPQRTSYVVRAAARGCFDATARPGFAAILDPAEGAMFTHPLQELGGGIEPC